MNLQITLPPEELAQELNACRFEEQVCFLNEYIEGLNKYRNLSDFAETCAPKLGEIAVKFIYLMHAELKKLEETK